MDVSAAVPDWLEIAGTAAAALTAVFVLGGLVGRSKLGRWLWRRLVADPFEDWTTRQLAPIHEAVAKIQADIAPTNGDRSSISDRVDKAKRAAIEVKTDLEAHRTEEGVERERRQDAVDERLDRIEETLAAGQQEIKGGIAAIAESRP